MHSMQLHWLIPAMLLSSDRLLDYSLTTRKSAVDEETNLKLLYRMALRDYQGYLQGRLRQEDIELALGKWIDITRPVDHLFILNELQHAFISWKGDRFEVEHSQLESWLTLLSQVDPTWVIGAGYSDYLDKGILSVDQVIELVQSQCPNALPNRFDGESVADNHVHLGGHGNYSLSMAAFALYLEDRPDDVIRERWPYRQEHSLFNSGTCDITKLPVMFHRLFGLLVSENLADGESNTYSWDSLDTYKISPYVDQLILLSPSGAVQRLLIAAINENGSASWLLLTIAILLLLRRSKSTYQISLARTFIQTASVLRNYMVVSGVGLGDFVDYFGFLYRKPVLGMDYGLHSQLYDLSDNHFREFRVAKNNYEFFAEAARVFIHHKRNDNIHFVYHFTRGFDKKDKDRRYTRARKSSIKSARKLQSFLSSVTFDSYPIMNENFTSSNRVDLRAMLRGFDVAGNENELPIEVFAPVLRLLRSATHQHKFSHEKRLRQPFITLHAGEDYGHLLSGLRAIDEAVVFCNYQPGDRIGHGLALGMDVVKWVERQQHIYLPLQEHLDNLVWCYQQGMKLITNYPHFQPAVMIIKAKIAHFCYELYGEEFSPRILYQAWLLRRNCPLTAEMQSDAMGMELALLVPDFELIQKSKKSSNTKIDSYDLWLKYLDRKRHDKDRTQVVSISYSKKNNINRNTLQAGKLEDTLSLTELDLIHGIQDLMLERFSQAQWILEACPTSNIYIGRLESYDEHPIYRWSPPKREELLINGKANRFGIRCGPVRVCINTDDAGLMPTTLENEHRVIKECAINSYGTSDYDASQWIDAIRKTGVEIFNSNHLKWKM